MRAGFWLGPCAAALLLAIPRAARADSADVSRAMDDWFRGERNEGYVFLGLGVASGGTSAYLFTRHDDFSRGAAYTSAALGALELAFASTYLLSLPPLKQRSKDDLASDPARFGSDETQRMRGISNRFVIYRYAELGVLAAGAGFATYGFARDKQVYAGIGVVAGTHAIALLVLDLFAEKRAHDYLRALEGASLGTTQGGSSRGFYLEAPVVSGRF